MAVWNKILQACKKPIRPYDFGYESLAGICRPIGKGKSGRNGRDVPEGVPIVEAVK